MKHVQIARRYAKAVFELANEGRSLEDVLQGMSNIDTALGRTPELRRLLFNPLVNPIQKRHVINKVTSNKLVLKLIELLAKRKRLELFATVHDELSAMSDHAKGVGRALIRTSQELSENDRREVEASVARYFGGKIIGRFEVAKELLGGVWVKVGDKVLDATIKGRLDTMRTALLHSKN